MPIFFAAMFLIPGCAAFILCAALRPLRRFALSASFWCVACAPCTVAVVVGFSVVDRATKALTAHLKPSLFTLLEHPARPLQITYFAVVGALIAAGAVAITLVHGWIVRRLTLYLFRIYVAFVSVGVGVLVAFVSGVALVSASSHLAEAEMAVFVSLLSVIPTVLAIFGFRKAHQFRDRRPDLLNPVTPEEYNSPTTSQADRMAY